METPVIFIIYNRPQTTARVFEVIRQVKPRQLLVIADGPRSDRPSDWQRCQATRKIVERVDWNCEILRNYSAENLGCRRRISGGLNWAFERVESALILEDDCIPDLTFFPFCEELLKRYDREPKVMAISGDNFQFGRRYTADSYYFSRYPHCWGWATWRRAWQQYDDRMSSWPQLRDSQWLETLFSDPEAVKYWSDIFENNYRGFNSWAYVWTLTCWSRNGLTILPAVNLISNIGFDRGATHTSSPSPFANMETKSMVFPMVHPHQISAHLKADEFTEKIMFSGKHNPRLITLKNTTRCKVCGSTSEFFDSAQILNKYDVDYFQCVNCGFIQTEDPYWLTEAYSEPIAGSDVGLVARNMEFSQIAENLILKLFNRRGKFLDYGCGYGLFVRLMRESGFDFYGRDRYCKNLFYQGFEGGKNIGEKYDLVTAFEVVEHLADPLNEIEEILGFSRHLFFSTKLLPNHNPKPRDWWYYALSEGQHISIYTEKALSIIAHRFNLNFYTYGDSLHLLTEKEVDPSLFAQLCQIKVGKKPGQLTEAEYLKEIEIAKNAAGSRCPLKVIVDGVFFQLNNTGIARVWRSLFSAWVEDGFADNILVLDRGGTAPQIPGIRYRVIPQYDYRNTEGDRQMLQRVCDEEKADLLISTYYTTPVSTPSVFMAYDMIPEVFGQNLNCREWREKHEGIRRAVSYIAISENTARDLIRFFPKILPDAVTIAHCGVESQFSPASDEENANFKLKYGISKPYFLIVGERIGWQSAKNTILFFQAFSRLSNSRDLEIVCVGGKPTLEPELGQYVSESNLKILKLSDAELKPAYSGAIALVYPSKYEGFGMPIVEAMACGCAVITCPNSSLLEVAGEAAIYVSDRDIDSLVKALIDVQKADIRQQLIEVGLERSQKFSWSKMAKIVGNALKKEVDKIKSKSQSSPRVSAIISTYNSANFLRGCLQDLISQTLYHKQQLEIIVIDSNSEENEKQIVSEFQAKYTQIIYHRTEHRETLYAAWNRAIELAKGEYITNANTDDRHRFDALELMANYLDQHSDVAVVYGDQLITHNPNETFENTQANQRWNWPEFSYQELERRCCLGSQPMWRKSLHQKYGNFNPEFKVAGDYEFWLRIGKTENIAKIPEILGLYFQNDRGLENADRTAELELNQILNQYGITQRVIQRQTSIPVSYSHGLNSDEPLVSIIIPCYNQGQYLDEAIASVVAQTYSNWECWIINDGSQDQTSSVVKRWLEKYGDRQLNLIETPNRGVVSARNLGFSKSRGELILCVDADDKIHPEFIAEACQILSKYPQVGFVYSDIQHFGENHETVSHGDFDLRSFLQQNQAPVTSLFRAEIYRNIGGFKTVMEAGWEDWEFWISACEIGWLGYRLPKPYLFYRQHSSGSRLQTFSSDRTTLAIQKARIIQLHPKLYNVDAFIWSYNILSQLESVGNPVSPMKSPKFPSIPSVSNSINRPLWSIMIPTYNGDTYLEETLNSILEQDLDPQTTEIEVVDDCSTAGDTEAIVKTVGRGRVKFYRQPHNLGLVENWNACINRSRGHWVHILHQDDRVLPGFYRQIQQVFEAFPEVGAVFCRHYYIDNSGKFKLLSNLEQENPGILNNWLERIAVRQEIQFPSIVVRRSVYEHLGGFYPPVGYAADWEMWKRIASYYPVGYQPTPLACWRMHSLSASSRSIKQAKDMADMQHSIEISAEYLPPDKTAHLSRQAQENYSLYALQTARKFLESGQATEAIAQIKAGLKLSQSPQVRDGVIALFIESEVDAVQDTQKLAREVDLAVQKYQNNPQDSDGLNKLRSLRHHLAELWLKLETEQLPKAYQENLGQAHKSLLNSGIKNEIFRDDERLYFQEIKSYLSQGFKQPKTFQYLLAGMLYGRADQLMLTFEESLIPTWLAEDYFRFLFDVPPLFQEIGDADNYSRYRIRLLDFVRERLQQQPDYPLWQKLTTMLLERGNFIPNYFADFNLKPLFCSRAELFHLFLQSRDFQLDYSFPEPPSDRQKIRLGILNDHLNPQTETYLTLPAFEYLNREQFEIILYVTQANNHPLEQYCRSRADRLVRLPDDKLEQAATIRADNLDILLFGTNVTAITKPVTLLALHRLARVQATLFSSPVTTGMRYIDYYISGHLSEGAEAPNFYRENLAVLNGTGFCFNYYAIAPQPATVKPHRSQWGANDQTIVFMSGANFYKIIPEQGETWVKILAQVPNSILVLYPFAPSWSNNYASSQFIRRMHATLSKYGVAEKRLVLIKSLPSRTDVKACLEQGDIYLDSYPHSGSNSLVDPLEVGLPVVVRDGDTLRSKHGAAMMRSLGIPDLITDDESSYISLAVTLANTPELLQLKRQAIQQKMVANPEFLDSRAYGAKMGALLTQIFQNYQSQQQVIDLDNPQKRQQFLAELVDQVNLYELDPTNTIVVNKLQKIRRGMVEYWLRQPPERLENLYQQQIGKGYQVLLNRGIQQQPLNDEEKALVNNWTKTAMGLTEPHAINCLMAVMLYSQPGKMLVRDAVNRLPAWLLPDYQRVFENADAIAQIKQTLATTKTQSTPVNSPQVTPTVTAVDVSTFVNRLIGCVKLFKIDPTDTNITVELRQLRWQFAQFWLNLPEQKLEDMYQSPLGDGYRSLLNSRLQNEMLTQHEWDFLQQVGTYLRQGLDTPRSLNYLIVAMLYYRPEKLQIQDLSRLPSYLQRDYQNWQNPLSS
ncbi:glycosyl transferase family 2 [Limnospira maxima CS-328]|uniref:Glycosyl transferase family 2 n=1 Tax=Limnospira maxima CS-328 TaxID=513049 RepID=B5W1M5_LIMMA|nr:glycosyltransferase [Limnospira maxima]EDZ94635.1 glycosyl transferase family 2 [Limnospira maxima CS-328]MDC0840339.1 glycosyltransferase [Limnoraphis robusta]